jgi:2,4-dienoyl-CoA reductase-like NADH-dependent reductase (Old Yellow Enzyme family)/NAD(P)-dependent dehydrogenase (short-subunit alcohol dehydrogenase family)
MPHFPHLQQPIRLGPLTIPNRIMLTTHGPRLSQPRYLRYIEERAKGGVGLMGFNLGPLGLMQMPLGPGRANAAGMADLDVVPPHPLTAEGQAYYDGLIPAYRAWAEVAHARGTKCIGQLYHPGAAQHTDTFQPTIAPSPVADAYERHNPHALTTDEIADLIQAYALCARRAVQAGYDGVELHAAHGYLPQQFLSAATNLRTDGYGGGLENRKRFLLEIYQAVRDAVGADYLVGIRLTAPEPVENGLTIDDLIATCRRLVALGISYVGISGGSYAGLRGPDDLPYVAPAFVPQGPNVPAAAAIKRAVDIPVIVSGRIADFDLAERIVASGEADMVGMVRALIADPHAIAKSFAGKAVTPCIGGNECHYGRAIACAANPAAGREAEMEIVPTVAPKRILVVGAGPAGLECAAAAAERGHHVVLADRRVELGGVLSLVAKASGQSDSGKYIDHMRRRIEAAGVEIRLGTEADAALVRDLRADEVVLATGADYAGHLGGAAVFSALRAIEKPEALGTHVAIVGGLEDHLPPLVLADFIARTGRRVTLLTETVSPSPALEMASLVLFLRRLSKAGVTILPMTAATGFTDGVLATRNSLTGEPGRIEGVDSVVLAGGRKPDNGLAAELSAQGLQVHLIGDALSPRRMLHATLDGARLGRAI